ncbi:MAG: hypothetical protein JNJ63_11140 [Hyphomonadaceae bacterium]|nr:hypothetical protein [Hyphomonadaceae bacterium]
MTRTVLAVLFLLAALGCALAFEAASAAAAALELAARAEASPTAGIKQRLLQRARERLESSWAEPLAWHAGAAEALSGVLYEQAAASGTSELYRASGVFAERAVRLSPVIANAWTRLAVLDRAGFGRPICSAAQCLANSWRAAPLLAGESACARIRVQNSVTPLSPDDGRIQAFLDSQSSERAAARCLDFLPPQELYRALLEARARRP